VEGVLFHTKMQCSIEQHHGVHHRMSHFRYFMLNKAHLVHKHTGKYIDHFLTLCSPALLFRRGLPVTQIAINCSCKKNPYLQT
jgi:hypothetical protein